MDDHPTNEPRWRLFETDQQRITALDASIVAIRGWTITLDSVLAGFAVSQQDRIFLLVALFATMFFAALDVEFRRVQLRHAERARRIESELAPDYRLFPMKRSADDRPSPPLAHSVRSYWTTLAFHAPLVALLGCSAVLAG